MKQITRLENFSVSSSREPGLCPGRVRVVLASCPSPEVGRRDGRKEGKAIFPRAFSNETLSRTENFI